jgi:dTDP-4-amino-4,6-dideoxygalactose transaminase
LMDVSREFGIPLILDSAQGLGAHYRGKPAGGFGLCEVFSLSPSKVITAVEGGLATTNDGQLAQKLKYMRDYGKGPDKEQIILNGLSARMSELHASVGVLSLRNAHSLVGARLRLIRRYADRLRELPGCRIQEIPADRTSSGNYFSLIISEKAGPDRDEIMRALKYRNIECKRYFYPPAHVQMAFRDRPHRIVGELPNTWAASRGSLALPLFAHMTDEQQDRICDVLESALGR